MKQASNPALAVAAWAAAHHLYLRPQLGVWKWTPDGNRVCSNCGMLEPDRLPGGCAIWDDEKRYCFHCGTRLLMPNKL